MPIPYLSTVPLHCIADGSRWNIHPFLDEEIDPSLQRSFSEVGILQPPLLIEAASGQFEILDGRKRVRAAREILALPECPCFLVPAASSPLMVLTLQLETQSCSSPLSAMEIAYFLRIGKNCLTSAELANSFLPLLAEISGFKHLRNYEHLLDLEKDTQLLVHNHFISEAIALELVKLAPDDRKSIVDFFTLFQMGGGKQKRLLFLAREIAVRSNTNIAKLLMQPSIQAILQHREMNNPQKLHTLLSFLQDMATPSVCRDETAFKAKISAMHLPSSCTVEHSQAFETDEVRLTIRFDTFEALQSTWTALKRILPQSSNQR